MANIKRANTSGITKSGAAISDVPDAPTIGAVSDPGTDGYASVAFTAATTGGAVTTYTATSTPGTLTGTSATSPISVTGLTLSTAYTFKVKGTNSTATGPESSASSSFTPTGHGAYDSIATVTLGSAASTITFSSIPSTYTHLQFRVMARDTATTGPQYSLKWQFNSDTGSNYTAYHDVNGGGSTTGSNGYGANTIAYLINTVTGSDASNTTQYGVSILDILDYASTNKYKTVRGLGGFDRNGSGQIRLGSSMWMNSGTAISSVIFSADGTQYATGTTIALYGIKGA